MQNKIFNPFTSCPHAFIPSVDLKPPFLHQDKSLQIHIHASSCQNWEEIIHVILDEMRSACACEPCHAFLVSTQGSLIAIVFCKGFIRWGLGYYKVCVPACQSWRMWTQRHDAQVAQLCALLIQIEYKHSFATVNEKQNISAALM